MAEKETGGQMNPMNMMKNMMAGGGPPMDMCMKMCKEMTQTIERTSEMAAYATPELRGLFESWLEEVETEAIKYIDEHDSVAVSELAEALGVSMDSAIFITSRLAKRGKVDASVKKSAPAGK